MSSGHSPRPTLSRADLITKHISSKPIKAPAARRAVSWAASKPALSTYLATVPLTANNAAAPTAIDTPTQGRARVADTHRPFIAASTY